MLQNLSPDVVQVEYANVGASIDSAEYKLKQVAFDLLSRSPSIRDFVVDTIKREHDKKYDRNIAAVLRSQSENWDKNNGLLSTKKYGTYPQTGRSINKIQCTIF